MANKKTEDNSSVQLNLFDMEVVKKDDNTDTEEYEETDIDSPGNEDLGISDEDDDRTTTITSELLTLKLLRQAIKAQNLEDAVMDDFSEYVLPNLLRLTIGVTAKGGKFFDRIDRKRIEEGKERVRRDNAGDQSLNTHLLNGLLPANRIGQVLVKLNTTIRRQVGELERRLAVAGFILHDFEKFKYSYFPSMPREYVEIAEDFEGDIRKLPKENHREIFGVLVPALGLDKLVCPHKPENWTQYLDDLLFIAYNAQRRNDTNLNLSEDGLKPSLNPDILTSLAELTCLADRLSSIIKHPQDAEKEALRDLLVKLSGGQMKFTYYSISENRGVLTNVVNNAVMEAHTAVNTPEKTYYQPLLYLSSGVIYLATKEAPAPDISSLGDRVVNNIKQLCSHQLQNKQTGFGRDGKGMKYADYYSQFFDDRGLMKVALEATLRILSKNKSSVAASRSENLINFQKQGVLPKECDFVFGDDIRIDQLAEFGDVITRKIWGDRLEKISALRKIDKHLLPPESVDLIAEVVQHWRLDNYLSQIRHIQRINENLKELKLKGNTGGVPYEWYYLAAKYLQHHPGIEDIKPVGEDLIDFVAGRVEGIIEAYNFTDEWEDVKEWVSRVVMLPGQPNKTTSSPDIFLKELNYYNAAKKQGRGRQLICSISHSSYSVTEQMESAVLFTPQVYTNKQTLGGSNSKRNISSIAGTEMMLRQILMNQTQAVGKNFEDGKYRYLYFYPTYYFTPETNEFLQKAYTDIAQTRFDTGIRRHFISDDLTANFARDNYQSVDAFLMPEDRAGKKNLAFKLSYPEDKPLTFYFMALPPGREPTDTESWIMPAWLAFAFPMILDVKTVVSESPIPPYRDGADFEETVFLDSAPTAFRVLTGSDRFRLDYILEGWQGDDGKSYPAPLNTLTAAYSIHLDVNAKQGKSGYDANWGKFTELAINLETSPLYVFHYLKQWTRGKDTDTPSINRIKLYTYDFYPCFDPYVQCNRREGAMKMSANSPLNHPLNLTQLYRQFYRADKRYNPKANAVLKPIDIAAETILKADLSFCENETLVNVVAAEISKLMDRVHASSAEGRWIIKEREQERQIILNFARYFVIELFAGAFKGDRARLAGKQLNLLRDTCEFIYRLEQDKENQELKAKGGVVEEESDINN
ncbi:MAG: hypothetical protein N5P05_002258 [Chroococcopsis gigantea SAG 12.99]|jgi:CRISPR-associated protein Csc3|nr:hypothetical protein [Chroococcopsis gigantea SAG 12.99]